MPKTTRGAAEDQAAENSNTTEYDQSVEAQKSGTTRTRRRGGRRVVRGTGAAGAAVALKVEERRAAEDAERAKKARKTQGKAEGSQQSEVSEDAEVQAAGKSATRARRSTKAAPLFQEPVIPDLDELSHESGHNRGHGYSHDDNRDRETERPRRTRRRRLNAEERRAADEVEQIEEDLESDDITYRPIRTRRARKDEFKDFSDDFDDDFDDARGNSDNRGEQDDRDDEEENDREGRRGRSTRRRSRRGGSHIERIERLDDDENDSFDDDDDIRDLDLEIGRKRYDDDENEDESEGRGGRRRRRHRGDDDREDRDEREGRSSRRKRGHSQDDDRDNDRDERESRRERRKHRGSDDRDEHDDASETRTRRRHRHDDEDDQPLTRRRRRRSGKDGRADDEERVGHTGSRANRSRKQQYIDEITDIEGSTRLAAKKQRRRDNRRERSRQSQIMEQDFLARRENVDRRMVVRQKGRHTQISVIEDNVLVEHYVSDIQEVATVGNIYLGRVQNVLPSMEAAFVDIGQPRNGVLYAGEVNWDTTRLEGQPRRIELAFKSGDPVLVQVTKDPIGHKGARLTSQVTLAGRFLVLVPSGGMTGVSRKLPEGERHRLKSIVSKIAPKDMGVIIRTAAEGASEEQLTADLEALKKQWEKIEQKLETYRHGKRAKLLQGEPDMAIRVVRDIFNDDFNKMTVEGDEVYSHIEEYLDTMAPDLKDRLEKWDPEEHQGKDVFDKWQIDSQLRKGMERQVYLPSGGSIVIDRTEAMTTIDVNTGRFIGKGKSLEETVTRCNLEASEEIARQLRLRDIGGMIMIDYVDMVMPANRDLVLRRLVECLARDRTKHQVAEVTSLGLVQMTRKRIGQGLVEAFSEECPTCKGRGFILHDEPTVSADYADPYAMKGGDPFVKTNKHGHGAPEVSAPKGSSPAVKAKLAQIAAAAVAAGDEDEDEGDTSEGR